MIILSIPILILVPPRCRCNSENNQVCVRPDRGATIDYQSFVVAKFQALKLITKNIPQSYLRVRKLKFIFMSSLARMVEKKVL